MKVLFIAAKKNFGKIDYSDLSKIKEDKVSLCYSIQFEDLAKRVKEIAGSKIIEEMQVLGCSSPAFSENSKAILIIGEGDFHPVALAYESGLKTYVFNENGLKEIRENQIESMKKREKGAYLKYLNSKKIGVLVSTKPGQQRLSRAIDFKKTTKNKKVYVFVTNDINVNEFENFGIESWVNSACPRMDLENKTLLNINDLGSKN
jgi:diphthamide biosynthesis enzyme Dph1/Dph2-like protein